MSPLPAKENMCPESVHSLLVRPKDPLSKEKRT